MNNKFKIILCIFFIELIALASCSLRPFQNLQNSKIEKSENIDSDLIMVGFSQLGSESDWRTANTKSIQKALTKENGFSLIFANGRQSQENQIKDVRRFIFQKVDYIVIAPVTETGWDTVLEEAKEAGIPIIIVDRMIDTKDKSLYAAYVGTDKYTEGAKAGQWLETYLKKNKNKDHESKHNKFLLEETVSQDENRRNANTINIVVLEGTLNSTAQIGRTKGFEEIKRHHKNWNILAHESGDFTKAKGKQVMEKYLKDFKDIDIVVSQNDDMTFGAIEAIQEAGFTCGVNGKITVISFDAVSEAFDRMEDGLMNADIECNPLQGPMIAKIIKCLEKGEKAPNVSNVAGKVFEAENAAKERIGRKY